MRAGIPGLSTGGRAGSCLLSTACRGVTHSHVSNNNPFCTIFHTSNAEMAIFRMIPAPERLRVKEECHRLRLRSGTELYREVTRLRYT